MANYFQALGLAPAGAHRCGCKRATLNGLGDAAVIPALVPISDRKAIAAAIRLFQQRRDLGLSDAAQAQGVVSMASTGAKAGSMIIPGIGTVIGGVVGAVVGWLGAKKKPVRPSSQQIQECQTLMSEYMGYAAQMPNQAIPLDRTQLLNMHWCLQALYGGKYIGVKDPRWFNPGAEGMLIPVTQQIVRKIYDTPVGQQVNIDSISIKDPKGRTLTFAGFNFVNPQFVNLKDFTERYWLPLLVKYCENTAGKGAPGCAAYYATPEFRRWAYDFIAWAARETLPNISEADLRAASSVAAQVGSSASDVVKAVEQIMGRAVQRDDTATVLPPPTTPPPTTAAPPPAVPVPSSAVPPTVAPPAVPAPPSLPPNATPEQIQSAIAQLTTMFMQTQQAQSLTQQQAAAAATAAAQQWLASQGVRAPPAAVADAANSAVLQAGVSNMPMWLGVAALGFALAVPSSRQRDRSRGPRRRR